MFTHQQTIIVMSKLKIKHYSSTHNNDVECMWLSL